MSFSTMATPMFSGMFSSASCASPTPGATSEAPSSRVMRTAVAGMDIGHGSPSAAERIPITSLIAAARGQLTAGARLGPVVGTADQNRQRYARAPVGQTGNLAAAGIERNRRLEL